MNVPTGLIVLWANSIASIPAGWQICDGTNGTPNLIDRFVIASGNNFPVGQTGGGLVHNHGFTGDGHTHEIEEGATLASGANISETTTSTAVTGTTNFASTLPPYYALAYIMKL